MDSRQQGLVNECIDERFQHEKFRAKFNKIIKEFIGKVEFMEKVQEYAGKEYGNRILRSTKFWTRTIITTIVTSLIAAIISILVTKNF